MAEDWAIVQGVLDYRNAQAIRAMVAEPEGFAKLAKHEHLMRLLAEMVSAAYDNVYTPEEAMTVLHASLPAKPANEGGG